MVKSKRRRTTPTRIRIANGLRDLQTCFHPNQDDCSGGYGRAHTVSKSAGLRAIADGGHVLMFNPRKVGEQMMNSHPWPEEVGVKKATTFTGFCRHHDNELFEPIDDHDPEPSRKNAGLLAYRALAREMYLKQTAVATFRKVLSDKRRRPMNGLRVDLWLKGNENGLRQLKPHHSVFETAIQRGDWSEFDYLWIEFSGTPAVGACGAIFPEFDFAGQQLQRLDRTPLDFLAINVMARDKGATAVLPWPRSNEACRLFVESLRRLPHERLGDAVVTLLFEHIENTAFAAAWWNGLGPMLRRALCTHVERLVHPGWPRGRGCLWFGTRRYVAWSVDSMLGANFA